MAKISRRVFLLLLGSFFPSLAQQRSHGATTKKPTKKPTPTPTPKKSTPTPTPSRTTATPSPSPTQTKQGLVIAKSSDLSLRQTKIFYFKDSFGISTGYSLTRTSRGVVAFDTRCTHAGVPTLLEGRQLECPAHGSIFDPESGDVIRGPALDPLKSYRTIEEDGEIRIIIS